MDRAGVPGLTVFAVPKPFDGHEAVIQRNALASWTRLEPRPEIVVFGDEAGTAEVCGELGLRHEPDVARNDLGTPLIGDVFGKAQRLARHDLLCYANSDIVFMDDFAAAAAWLSAWRPTRRVLMVGVRCNVPIDHPLDFDGDWRGEVRRVAARQGVVAHRTAMDYFVFRRGLYARMPPFAVGRRWWDTWAFFHARRSRAAVVDASRVVTAYHQNHDYGHVGGTETWMEGPEASASMRMAGPAAMDSNPLTTFDATHVLTRDGVIPSWRFHGIPWVRHEVDRAMLYHPALAPPIAAAKVVGRAVRRARAGSRRGPAVR